MPKQVSYSQIYRSENNQIIGGVCGGLGEYFNIDPNIIRLIFILLTVFGGSGLIIYLVLWIILPRESQTSSGIEEIKEKAKEFAHDIRNSVKDRNTVKPQNRKFIAYAAIILGVIFLLNNFGYSNYLNLDKLWPLLLILLGISLILRR